MSALGLSLLHRTDALGRAAHGFSGYFASCSSICLSNSWDCSSISWLRRICSMRSTRPHGGQSVEVRVVFHGGTSALGQGLEQARVPAIGSATRAHSRLHGTPPWPLRGCRPRRLDLMRPFPAEPMRMWPITVSSWRQCWLWVEAGPTRRPRPVQIGQ